MNSPKGARLAIILSMTVFGTIGAVVRYIDLPSSVTAMWRGVIGTPFLLLLLTLTGKKLSFSDIRSNIVPLLLAGTMLGFNWILMFEAYRFTSVAIATVCYYIAPIIVVAASPVLFGEKLGWSKLLCVAAAILGMLPISGLGISGLPVYGELRGVFLALGAAVLYAGIVICNKRLHGISAFDKTVVQLAVSAAVLLIYNLVTGKFAGIELSRLSLIMLIAAGIVHTGLAYYLYFGALGALPAQTAAILSYIDPVVAVLVSALVLGEGLTLPVIIGTVLIIGSAVVCDLIDAKATETE